MDTGLEQFNAFQNAMAGTFNPELAKTNTKEMIGNLLLMFGTQFFMDRLKKHLDPELFEKIQTLVNDPKNIIGNSKKLATELFNNKVLQPAKKQLLEKASEYVPELKNIDLENASINDVVSAFQKGVLDKMKASLPDEIARNLPENFTRDDIFTALRDSGSDVALKFAKDNLPPEVYSTLEQNQDLIRNPGQIAEFVRTKLDAAKDEIKTNINQVKENAQQAMADIKQELSSRVDDFVKPYRDKLESLKQQKAKLADDWQKQTNDLQQQFDEANQAYDDFISSNPQASFEDLQPFKNAISDIKQQAKSARSAFRESSSDFDDQITKAQYQLDAQTDEAMTTFRELLNQPGTVVQKAQAAGENLVSQAVAKAEETTQKVAQTVSDGVSAAVQSGEEAGSGFITSMKQGFENLRQRASNFFNPSRPTEGPTDTPFGYSLRDAGELENDIPTEILSRIGTNTPILESYYGTLLDKTEQASTAGKQLLKKIKVPQTKPSKPVIQERPIPTQPEFTDQDEARRLLASGQTDRPIEVLPRGPAPSTAPAVQQLSEGAPTATTTPEEKPELPDLPGLGESPATAPPAPPAPAEIAERKPVSTAAKVGQDIESGLEDVAPETQEVPVLDWIVDVGGILGSIFGGTKLMEGKTPAEPLITASAYEPDL